MWEPVEREEDVSPVPRTMPSTKLFSILLNKCHGHPESGLDCSFCVDRMVEGNISEKMESPGIPPF